jgi:hypothetical protein
MTTSVRSLFFSAGLSAMAVLFCGCPAKPSPTGQTQGSATEIALVPKDAQTGADGSSIRWTASLAQGEDGIKLLVFKATLDEGWVIYSVDQDNADGPNPTVITLTGEGSQHVGEPSEVGTRRVEDMDETFGMPLVRFAGDLTLTQGLTVNDPSLPITGTIAYDMTNGEEVAHHLVEFSVSAQ